MLSAGLTAERIKAKRVPSLSPLNQGFSPTQESRLWHFVHLLRACAHPWTRERRAYSTLIHWNRP
jgi:hypothetical protein